MTKSQLLSLMCTGMMSMAIAAVNAGGNTASLQTPAPGKTDNPCPLKIEQVAAITGMPMTNTGACTFFPANGRDIPHVFYVRQTSMVCNAIKPADLGFTETVAGLPAKAAYVKDKIDGAHVLVCPNGDARAFDIVVEIKNDKAKNREAAIGLAKQVLAGR